MSKHTPYETRILTADVADLSAGSLVIIDNCIQPERGDLTLLNHGRPGSERLAVYQGQSAAVGKVVMTSRPDNWDF